MERNKLWLARKKQSEELPDSTLNAIREGRASPTLEVALTNSDEVFSVFRDHIKEMDTDQRKKLAEGLRTIETTLTGQHDELDLLHAFWYQTFSPILCVILGWTAEQGTGVPGLTVGGIVTALTARSYLGKLGARQRQAVLDRLQRCRALLTEAKAAASQWREPLT